MTDDDPLEELISETKQKSENFEEKRSEIMKAKDQLRDRINSLYEKDEISEEGREKALKYVDRGEYEKAREVIKANDSSIHFDDSDKAEFAEAFKEEYEDMVGVLEQVRNQIVLLNESDRDKLVPYLYGKNVAAKRDLRTVFDTLEELERTDETEMAARIISSKNSSLSLTDTREILNRIKEEADLE